MQMDIEDQLEDVEGVEKRQRKRQKKLFNKIRDQMEFYFGDSNLNKDRFLSQCIQASEDGFISLDIFMKFNRIRAMTENVETIAQSLLNSTMLQLSDDRSRVRRVTTVGELKNVDDCTLYVENLPPHADHDWLKKIFSAFGKVNYVSLPKFKTTQSLKGFAFIEFGTPEEANKALKALCKDFNNSEQMSNLANDHIDLNINSSLKRKRQDSDDEKDNKCRKIGVESDLAEDKNEHKKSNKHRKRKKKHKVKVKESHNLKVMSKQEWIVLKAEYRTLQKANMASLKNSLIIYSDDGVSQNQQTSNPNIEFVPGVIVKITSSNEICSVREFKKKVQVIADVAYVDIKEGQKEGYIRCKNSKAAENILNSASEWENEKLELITGNEEQNYWQQIWRDREVKFCLQDRPKKRGKEKVLHRREKFVRKSNHIHFDD